MTILNQYLGNRRKVVHYFYWYNIVGYRRFARTEYKYDMIVFQDIDFQVILN